MELPTVTLRNRRGQQRIVNEFDYALDIAKWTAEGYRRVGETGSGFEDEVVADAVREAVIQHERERTREPPKDFAARSVTVGTPVVADVASDSDLMPTEPRVRSGRRGRPPRAQTP